MVNGPLSRHAIDLLVNGQHSRIWAVGTTLGEAFSHVLTVGGPCPARRRGWDLEQTRPDLRRPRSLYHRDLGNA